MFNMNVLYSSKQSTERNNTLLIYNNQSINQQLLQPQQIQNTGKVVKEEITLDNTDISQFEQQVYNELKSVAEIRTFLNKQKEIFDEIRSFQQCDNFQKDPYFAQAIFDHLKNRKQMSQITKNFNQIYVFKENEIIFGAQNQIIRSSQQTFYVATGCYFLLGYDYEKNEFIRFDIVKEDGKVMIFKPQESDIIRYILKYDLSLSEQQAKYSEFYQNLLSDDQSKFTTIKFGEKMFPQGQRLLEQTMTKAYPLTNFFIHVKQLIKNYYTEKQKQYGNEQPWNIDLEYLLQQNQETIWRTVFEIAKQLSNILKTADSCQQFQIQQQQNSQQYNSIKLNDSIMQQNDQPAIHRTNFPQFNTQNSNDNLQRLQLNTYNNQIEEVDQIEYLLMLLLKCDILINNSDKLYDVNQINFMKADPLITIDDEFEIIQFNILNGNDSYSNTSSILSQYNIILENDPKTENNSNNFIQQQITQHIFENFEITSHQQFVDIFTDLFQVPNKQFNLNNIRYMNSKYAEKQEIFQEFVLYSQYQEQVVSFLKKLINNIQYDVYIQILLFDSQSLINSKSIFYKEFLNQHKVYLVYMDVQIQIIKIQKRSSILQFSQNDNKLIFNQYIDKNYLFFHQTQKQIIWQDKMNSKQVIYQIQKIVNNTLKIMFLNQKNQFMVQKTIITFDCDNDTHELIKQSLNIKQFQNIVKIKQLYPDKNINIIQLLFSLRNHNMLDLFPNIVFSFQQFQQCTLNYINNMFFFLTYYSNVYIMLPEVSQKNQTLLTNIKKNQNFYQKNQTLYQFTPDNTSKCIHFDQVTNEKYIQDIQEFLNCDVYQELNRSLISQENNAIQSRSHQKQQKYTTLIKNLLNESENVINLLKRNKQSENYITMKKEPYIEEIFIIQKYLIYYSKFENYETNISVVDVLEKLLNICKKEIDSIV